MSIGLRFRNKVTFKDVVGESNAVTTDMVSAWFKRTLPTLLRDYNLRDIFNADEFGLFYQALPGKTLHLKEKKCSEGKHIKVRLSGIAAANAYGEKLPMFVTGNLRNQGVFQELGTYRVVTEHKQRAG